MSLRQKTVVVGAGPVGSLAALYAAQRGHEVEIYELRDGECLRFRVILWPAVSLAASLVYNLSPRPLLFWFAALGQLSFAVVQSQVRRGLIGSLT